MPPRHRPPPAGRRRRCRRRPIALTQFLACGCLVAAVGPAAAAAAAAAPSSPPSATSPPPPSPDASMLAELRRYETAQITARERLFSEAAGDGRPGTAGGGDSNPAPAASVGLSLPATLGESSLIDRGTGRIFWQGGPSVLLLSSGSALQNAGVKHIRATALTMILLLSVLSGMAARWREVAEAALGRGAEAALGEAAGGGTGLGRWIDELGGWIRPVASDAAAATSGTSTGLGRADAAILFLRQLSLLLARLTVLLPRFDRWFIVLVAALYLSEAYFCSTRRYLAHALSGPGAVEEYVEGLRRTPPMATWTVRCYHHEKRKGLGWLDWLLGGLANAGDDAEGGRGSTADTGPSLLTRKVVTHHATEAYQFPSWKDQTTVGLWKRAWSPDLAAPFTKLSLSKVLLLADDRTREDYFRQQTEFVTREGQRDQHAEFSTMITVDGFKSKALAVKPVLGVPSSKLFRLNLFWAFTLFGLTVPYRVWFARHCDELRVTIIKETFAVTPKPKRRPRAASSSLSTSWSRWFASRSAIATQDSANSGSGPQKDVAPDNDASAFRRQMQDLAIYEKESAKEAGKSVAEAVVKLQQHIEDFRKDQPPNIDEKEDVTRHRKSDLIDEEDKAAALPFVEDLSSPIKTAADASNSTTWVVAEGSSSDIVATQVGISASANVTANESDGKEEVPARANLTKEGKTSDDE